MFYPPPSSPRPTITVTAIEGQQTGSCIELVDAQEYLVGSDLNNQVVFYSPQDEGWQALLRWDDDSLLLVVNSGVVTYNSTEIKPGESIVIESGSTIKSGGCAFTCAWEQGVQASKSKVKNQFDQNDSELILTDKHPLYKSEEKQGRFVKHRSFLLVAAALLVMPWSFTDINLDQGTAHAIENKLISLLAQPEYADVSYAYSSNQEKLLVTGSVKTRDEFQQIRKTAQSGTSAVGIDLQIDAELATAIEDILRVNGYRADVKITGVGTANVHTYLLDSNAVHAIEELLKRDVSNLSSLTITNSKPELMGTMHPPGLAFDSAKKIELISAGNQGYVMTKDKTMYTVGSLLPNGHTLTKIQGDALYVSANGKNVKLELQPKSDRAWSN